MKKVESAYMARVAALPCVLCGAHGVHVHHLREGQGMSQRASNWMTIPLCPECHTGVSGIHGNKAMLNIRKLSELDLLALTIEALNS
jgi:5-methylcytosine-specific restriction endonuclease McrA